MNNWQEFENKSPEWKNEGEEPPEVRKTEGYAAGWTVPAGWLNWFWARVSKCLTELQSKVKDLWQDVAGSLQNQCTELDERLSLLEHMGIMNDFFAPIATDDEDITLLVDDLGFALMADWKYKEM